MNTIVLAILCFAAGALMGAALLYWKSKAEVAPLAGKVEVLEADKQQISASLQKEQARAGELASQLSAAERDLHYLNDKLQNQSLETEKLQERFTKEFENLAHKILQENSQQFSTQNKESLQNILNPLKDKISEFEKKVENTNKESIDMHAALRQQILGLRELNEQMSKEALNLTKALKGDAKKQGNWGELVLERVLEKSGLEKGREYDVQQSFQREDGSRVLPDVVIHLPDGKKMIIDSKVSLVAYEQYVNSEDEAEQQRFMKAHIDSINKHVDSLGAHNYHDLYQIASPDFVLMFIPIEPAFALAINHDEKLYNRAFDKNIVIVTPSTLLATLRTIDTMWSNDKQQKNALEIATQAGALYDKFHGLMEDLIKVGKKLRETDDEYKGAMNKLFEGKGNLVSRVENLKKLGAKANKSLPDNVMGRAGE